MIREGIFEFFRFLRFSRAFTLFPFMIGAFVLSAEETLKLDVFTMVLTAVIVGLFTFFFYNRTFEIVNTNFIEERETYRLWDHLSLETTAYCCVVGSVLFILTCYQVNTVVFYSSPVFLGLQFAYVNYRYQSYWNHGLLGVLSTGLVIGPYLALRGAIPPEGILLAGALFFWILGLDSLYSIGRIERDIKNGIHSVARSHGVPVAIRAARLTHVLSLFCFCSLGIIAAMDTVYAIFILGFSVGLFYQHYTIENRSFIETRHFFFGLHVYLSIGFLTSVTFERFLSL